MSLNINKLNVTQQSLSSIFLPDQLEQFARKNKPRGGARWSNECVTKCFQLKFACGINGYNAVIGQGIPYPSNRTLTRRLESLKLAPGILHEVFDFLEHKVASLNTIDKNCTLAIDEMSIEPCVRYDISNDILLGNTLDGPNEKPTHALVFLLCGLASRWKQPVAYFFTGNTLDVEIFRSLLVETVMKIESIGLKVHSVTTDMGFTNMKLWKAFGISAGKDTAVQCSTRHRSDPKRQLFFFPDVVHILKNIVQNFVVHEEITLSSAVANKFDLPSNKVQLKHLREMFEQERQN